LTSKFGANRPSHSSFGRAGLTAQRIVKSTKIEQTAQCCQPSERKPVTMVDAAGEDYLSSQYLDPYKALARR